MFNSSLFNIDDNHENKNYDSLFNNFGLKFGIIIDSFTVEDNKNITKNTTEYDVFVFEKSGRDPSASTIYKNCTTMQLFGGVADFMEFDLRKNNKKDIPFQNDAIGSMVLILALNGNTNNGVIVGSLHNPNRQSKLNKENGHMLEAEFNGVNWNINKDGEFTIKFRSATDINGKQADEKAGGSFIKIDKTGSITFSDNNKENIVIDKTKKTISVNAESDILFNSQAKVKITSKDNTEISCKDLIATASGRSSFAIKGDMELKVDGPVHVKGASAKIETDGSIEVQSSMVKIAAPTIELGEGGTPALIMSTMYVGIGNLGVSVISFPVGPFSSIVKIAT